MIAHRRLRSLLIVVGLLVSGAGAAAQDLVRHDLTIVLEPASHRLSVTDAMTLPSGLQPGGFLLNARLQITDAKPAIEAVPLGDTTPFFGNNGTANIDPSRVKRYRFVTEPTDGRVRVTYSGVIDFALSAQKEEYTRGFRETIGLVGPEGVYLAGSTFWYPHLSSGLVSFTMRATGPDGWHLISQGTGTSRGAGGDARWEMTGPSDEIYLVGGPLRMWRESAGAVDALVYLRADEPGLAQKYLAATAQYLEMYRSLIGPYPYTKFALVENFWETGYGMPSFTLLGSTVLRFPFILTSSYPHEILHNWWGNGVFVDYASGNWCEGLTAYLADHLIQEQRGKGDEYRRATLQKYRNYVKAERDFPLTEFRSRESAATEAVGYGKTLMTMHMLRRRLGDERFRTFLARLWREQRGKQASFADLQRTAESLAGESLATFFTQWVTRPGAPVLGVEEVVARTDGDRHVVEGVLLQRQEGPAYVLDVPLVVQTARGSARHVVTMTGARQRFSVPADGPAQALVADPRFDVFRKLDPRETPPSIGQIFGEARVTAVIPAGATPAEQKAYRDLVTSWQSENHDVEIVDDNALGSIPDDRSVWLLGRENRLARQLMQGYELLRVSEDGAAFAGEVVPFNGHTTVVTLRHPRNVEKAVGWIVVDPPAAFAGVARKLPHYGRYSYLGFEGDEPVNTVKGEWPATDSPLRVDLRPRESRGVALPPSGVPAERPLIDLPPVFSEQALSEHVRYLAAPEREGRVPGSKGIEAAATYVAERFKSAGLEPAGDGGSYFQRFTIASGPDGTPVQTANVIGVLRGSRAEWASQTALVTAHYDHLGRGWPDARAGDAGTLHPGADDNASGVAVLLELARVVAGGERPPRSIVFVAFSGEETGVAGATHYATHPVGPLDKVIGVINLDTVGRLGSGKVAVLGTGTATEWPHIFRGASFVTGVESSSIAGSYEASDQRVFIERGVPAVQVFTGPHADYHRPTDTADKVDIAGLVKVATLAREAVVYLGDRADPLTATIAGASTAKVPAPAGGPPASQARRVTFGAVPDFAFEGTGVRLSGVTAGSPAERAGMKEGDVITRVGDRPVANLREFSHVLRTLTAGQSVTVVYVREGQEQSASVTVVER